MRKNHRGEIRNSASGASGNSTVFGKGHQAGNQSMREVTRVGGGRRGGYSGNNLKEISLTYEEVLKGGLGYEKNLQLV